MSATNVSSGQHRVLRSESNLIESGKRQDCLGDDPTSYISLFNCSSSWDLSFFDWPVPWSFDYGRCIMGGSAATVRHLGERTKWIIQFLVNINQSLSIPQSSIQLEHNGGETLGWANMHHWLRFRTCLMLTKASLSRSDNWLEQYIIDWSNILYPCRDDLAECTKCYKCWNKLISNIMQHGNARQSNWSEALVRFYHDKSAEGAVTCKQTHYKTNKILGMLEFIVTLPFSWVRVVSKAERHTAVINAWIFTAWKANINESMMLGKRLEIKK